MDICTKIELGFDTYNPTLRNRMAVLLRVLIVTVVLSMAWPQLQAAETVGIRGLGAVGCDQYNRDISQRPQLRRDYFAWAQGLMSGVLLRAPPGKDTTLNLEPPEMPLEAQVTFLGNYCAQNPGKDFVDGVLELYRQLRVVPHTQ